MTKNKKIKSLQKILKNPQEAQVILRWMFQLIKPFIPGVFFVFAINVFSICISYASTIIGKYVVDDATSGDINLHNMTIMCSLTVVSILIGVISRVFNDYINERFSFGIRMQMFERIQKTIWREISDVHSGDILTRLTSDLSLLADGLISILPNLLLLCTQLIISFVILYYYDPTMAMIALIIGPAGLISALLLRKKYIDYQLALHESESKYRSFIQECLSNIVVMKTFQQEDSNNQKLEKLRTERLDIILKSSRLSALMGAFMKLVYNVGYVVAFCWGAYRISSGHITYGTLTVFISLVSQVQGNISSLASIVPMTYRTLISAKRLYDVSELEKEKSYGYDALPDKVGITIRNVDFSYQKDLILHNVNLSINPGEKIGIVGESGAGKTTLIRLFLALTKPINGTVEYTYAGTSEIAGLDSRRFISYVPQGNTLLSGTIRDNLLIGKNDATDEEMWESLRMAGAEKFMKKLPEGLDSKLTEKAGGISEGQAQRISIARALIGKKPLMIFDEATSALDEKTEALILDNIARNYEDITCIIITHRRSMLKYCDRVVEILDDGVVSESKK